MQLLMTTLHGAVALAQGHVVAVVVSEHLHLDVTRAQHELLQVDLVVAERGAGLGAGGLVVRLKVGGVVDLAHALAAAAGGRLDEHRIAHALGEPASLLHGIRCSHRNRGRWARRRPSWSRGRRTLLPMRSMHSAEGPMNTRSLSAHARAKSAFSAKKP